MQPMDVAAGDKGDEARAEAAADFDAGVGPGAAAWSAVLLALLDDLNTPAAVSELSAPLKSINDLLTTKAGKKRPDRLKVLAEYESALMKIFALLGLMGVEAAPSSANYEQAGSFAAAAISDMRSLALVRMGLDEVTVLGWIEERKEARANKDFARGDELRDEMAVKGILIMDTPEGTTWRPGSPP
eukprot:gene28262-31367_t